MNFRSLTREKLRFNEQIELERKAWLEDEKKLRNSIHQLQKDNNLIMVIAYSSAIFRPTFIRMSAWA